MAKSPDAFRTISEVSEWLDTPAHVLRFWESRFPQVRPVKRAGGRRYYRPADMYLLGGIKRLLHDDGITIKGVKKILREKGVRYVASLCLEEIEGVPRPAPPATAAAPEAETTPVEALLDDAGQAAKAPDEAPPPAEPMPEAAEPTGETRSPDSAATKAGTGGDETGTDGKRPPPDTADSEAGPPEPAPATEETLSDTPLAAPAFGLGTPQAAPAETQAGDAAATAPPPAPEPAAQTDGEEETPQGGLGADDSPPAPPVEPAPEEPLAPTPMAAGAGLAGDTAPPAGPSGDEKAAPEESASPATGAIDPQLLSVPEIDEATRNQRIRDLYLRLKALRDKLRADMAAQ